MIGSWQDKTLSKSQQSFQLITSHYRKITISNRGLSQNIINSARQFPALVQKRSQTPSNPQTETIGQDIRVTAPTKPTQQHKRNPWAFQKGNEACRQAKPLHKSDSSKSRSSVWVVGRSEVSVIKKLN